MPEAPAVTGASLAGHAGPILFIADAGNRLERGLLDDCLEQHCAATRQGAWERVFLDLSGGGDAPDATPLETHLGVSDDTLLAPVRIAWTVPVDSSGDGDAGAGHEPLPLRQLAFGDPRRPGALRGRHILRRDPGRARCLAAAPATLGELKRRFAGQHGAPAAMQPQAFAAFIARQAALALEIAEWGLIGRRYKVPRFVA
ncbi:MAG: hypothetical protein R3233_04950 [Xanthomonadales bacterium]|nr:hypothetical protein [Xanthomonadales bacterium]